MKVYSSAIRSILLSYSEIFFLKNPYIGAIIIAVTFLNPTLGISGLFSILTAYGFARYVGYQKEFLQSGHYTYNALLVGLSIGQLFSFSPLSAIYIAIAAVLTFVITVSLVDIFSRYFALPILSIPFVIVTSLIYLSAARFSNLFVNDLYAAGHIELLNDTFPVWVAGFLKSLGAIIFMPSVAMGLLLISLILIHSRVLFLLAVVGYYFGIALQGAFTGSYLAAFQDLNTFNYPLIAMAIGAVFNIPTIKSYTFAMIGVATATILIKSIDIFWAQYGIPVFTLPFLIITQGYIYVLGLLKYPYRPLVFKDSPEQTAEYFYTQKIRYPMSQTFHLPFTDSWSVYQGFDGQWTHQGIWKYAYDFVKRNEKGLSYENEGKYLTDYFCFKQPVTSPCRGYVVYVADSYKDNAIGVVDTLNKWGNYVIIQDERGYFVGVCHLSQFGVWVKPGDWVEPYQQIGLCGNSGYSPEPHVHMQYQTTSMMSSVTLPFCYTGVLSDEQFEKQTVPEEDTTVTPALTHPFYLQIANFILDEKLSFKVFYKDNFVENVTFKVKMELDSTFYLAHKDSRLYLGKSDSVFYFYHLVGNSLYLKLLYQAMPSMPLNYLEHHKWQDIIPEKYLGGWLHSFLTDMKLLLNFKSESNANYAFTTDTVIEGEIKSRSLNAKKITKMELDPYVKFKRFQVGDYTFICKQNIQTGS